MKMKFVAAMKHYFGFLPGQTLTEFMAECRELDRPWWIAQLQSVGYEIDVS